MKDVYKKNELAFEILKGVLITGGVLACLVLPGMAVVLNMFLPKNKKQENKIKRSYDKLIKNEYLSIEEIKGETFLRITEKGEAYLMRADFDKLVLKNPKNWDKKWRVVMFDIPEKYFRERRMLSYKLFELGMYQYQKSVYIYPYDCTSVISFASKFLDVEKYVQQMTVTEIDNLPDLKKFFKLK